MSETPKRGRGRPKGTGRLDPDDIIDAAYTALSAGGYPALKMRGVARSLGVSLATVQHHFPTKDSLFRAAIERLVAETTAVWDETDPMDLVSLIAASLSREARRPGLQAALLTDQSPGHAERLELYVELFREAGARSRERATDLIDRGVTRDYAIDSLFLLLTVGVGSIAGASHAVKVLYGLDLDSDRDRERLAGDLADVIVLGLHPR